MKEWIKVEKELFGKNFWNVLIVLFPDSDYPVIRHLNVLTDDDIERLAQELIEGAEAL